MKHRKIFINYGSYKSECQKGINVDYRSVSRMVIYSGSAIE